jgi:hypothetical protein
MPVRALVGDPFDLRRRRVSVGIGTLTLRRDRRTGRATFLLHWRDPTKVAGGGATTGLVPEGEFQPSGDGYRHTDLDLWRNIVREYSEELLGEPERPGGDPALHRRMTDALAAGRITAHCLGLGVSALSFGALLMTVVVFDDDVFDELFEHAVAENEEGTVLAERPVFDGPTVQRLVGHPSSGGAAVTILARAWAFRDVLVPRPG